MATMDGKTINLESYIGECLRSSRKWRNMTQSEVASASGLSQQTYSNYENGIRRCPASTLYKIAQVLDLPIDFILDQSLEYDRIESFKDLEEVMSNMPEEDIDIFLHVYEREDGDIDISALEWADRGIDIAQNVNETGQDMINQFIESVMLNPSLLKT